MKKSIAIRGSITGIKYDPIIVTTSDATMNPGSSLIAPVVIGSSKKGAV